MKYNFKKSLTIIFVLISVLAFGIFSVSAAEPAVAVASSEFLTRQGETFTTTIFIPDNANIVDFDITLKYDTDIIKLVNAEEHDDIKGTVVFNTEQSGVIALNYTRTSKNVTSYLPIVNLTFEVDENAGIGSYDCFSIDESATYIAHTLNDSGILDPVDFACDFAKLEIYEMGDVDLNSTLNIADATYIRRHLAEIPGAILEGFKLSLADTYYDGLVNIADAVGLQRHLAHLDVVYGDRINVTFIDLNGEICAKKSVIYGGTLYNIPLVPNVDGYSNGVWSQSATEFVEPIYNNLQSDITLYAIYEEEVSADMIYYKRMLTDKYYSGDLPTGLSKDQELWDTFYYQEGCYANFIWSSDSNYILNASTGKFTKPTYPSDLTLTVKILAYDANDKIKAEDSISFDYAVPGEYITPTKTEIADWIKHYFTDSVDGEYRVNYDVKLVNKLNNAIIPSAGSLYDNFEIRLAWYEVVDGVEAPISRIKRKTSSQICDYVAVATFNGKPIEGDGKIYVDNVEVTAIEQIEIKNYIIQQISATGTLATNLKPLWNNDNLYGTTVTWETGNVDIAYVENNVIKLKDDAISGSTLPLNARVSYMTDDGEVEEFILSYNLTVSCNNTVIKAPENMDVELYKAIKAELEEELDYRGDITSAALSNVKFVNLDLSDYPEIKSLKGLSYCTNLRTLNISGLQITDGTMNQIATLSYLEAFIARDCGLDNLADGGTPTLKNAVNLKMLDLSNNNFTSLDSVFAADKRYGNLREVYLSNNKLTDINALQRAPLITYLSLANNGLTTEGTAAIANYPYLQYLSLANNNIDSVTNLKNSKELVELRLHNNKLTDVRALRGLVNLEILYLGHNQIQDIGFFDTLTALEVLYVNDNKIFDISTLTSLSNLEVINVSNNNISSLSVLRNYKNTLTEIYAENNKLTDFSFINGASNLHILMLAGNNSEIAQSNMTTWLSGLSGLEVLTLSDITLNDLSFLDSMSKLVRLDVANCRLNAFTGEISNVEKISKRYETLKILNMSNNDMRGYEAELLKLADINGLTVFYADNICDKLDMVTLTYSMPELRYISLENCGIDSIKWLSNKNNITYVDLANNNISAVDLNSDISVTGIKTIKELYLDTNVPCVFTDAYRIADMNVSKLSLAGISVDKMEKLPYLDNISYLNLANTGLTNLTGDDPELEELYSINRYATVKTLDISGLKADISPVEALTCIETVYAVGTVDSELCHEDNLHALQRMYNKGITCYLYDKQTEYVPAATVEGKDILNLLKDISCDITVAADNMISDNNPVMIDEINDFDIRWSVSNSDNYEIVNNRLSVKSYKGLEDETLTITAQITVYPDQEPVSREFEIKTNILRASAKYLDINATGYSENLTRDKSFTYDLKLKAVETEGFANPVKPVEDNITYSYSAVKEDGGPISYDKILTVNENNSFSVASGAPLNGIATIKIDISHNRKDGTVVNDTETRIITVKVVSRTFTVDLVLNGGSLVDANGINRERLECVEDSLIFEGLTISRTGYLFEGWYLDEELKQEYSKDGTDAIMPSENITLYAKWKPHYFNLKFDPNGGTVSTTSQTILCDTPFGELPIPTRNGYTFNGWFTENGEKLTATTTMASAEDVTAVADWTIIPYTASWTVGEGYTITVERTSSPNGNAAIGKLNSNDTVYYGDELSISYTASTGYTLTDKGMTSIKVTDNVTSADIFAAAKVNSYTVSWNTGTDYSITVERTSSPKGKASVGALKSKDIIYYGDALSIKYVASEGYYISKQGKTSITVIGNVTSNDVYANVEAKDITYNIVYKSSNGTALGSSTVTYKFGTTNTISAPAKDGYYTPSDQIVKWDSVTPKTITFIYAPIPVSNPAITGNFRNSSPKITYSTQMNYRNRTANSVEVQITTTVKMQSGWSGFAYGVAFDATCGSASSGKVQISKLNELDTGGASREASTGWITVPLNTTNATTASFNVHMYNTNWKNNYVNDPSYVSTYFTWTINIPAF